MPPADDRTRADLPDNTISGRDDIPLTDGATSGAESFLRLLKRAAPSVALPSTPALFPTIPDYEIECELGRGGMGVVYKARHVPLNRIVAIKMILTSEHATASEIARFRAEAEAIAAIKHANVVQVYDLGPEGCTRPYFAMEYVAGGSLAKFLKANGRQSPTAAAELLAAVADGLQAAHDAGIVHRDIKPANILLAKDEGRRTKDEQTSQAVSGSDSSFILYPSSFARPKVSDFGLAKRLASDVTRTMAPAGTPAYMAPEQAGGKSKYVGPGADVYSLGAVLYECLTGAPPFEGTDQWEVVEQVLTTQPVSPRSVVPAVPRDLELICLTCLEKEPHHRYHSAAALADDLRRFLAGKPVSVRPIGPVTRTSRWAKRRPTAAALVALVAAVCFAVPAAIVWTVGESEQHATETAAAKDREDAAREEERLARIAEEQQRLARIEADKAAAAALRLADVRDLFAIQNKLHSRIADRPLSWTYANRADLLKAVMLAAGEPTAVGELRSAAAVAFLSADLKPLPVVMKGFTASAAATDPKTGRIAVGEYLFRFSGRVRLIDPATGESVRELVAPAGWVNTQPDSVRALAFSPDGKYLFVGLRSSTVLRFDLDTPENKPSKTWKASTSPVEQLTVSPDGATVYGLCRPEKPVFAWATDTGKLVAKLEPSTEAPFGSFAVLATGDVIACDTHQIRRWTPDHNLVQTVPNCGARRLAPTGAGALLVGDGRNLDVYDRDTLVPLDRFVTSELRRGVHEEYVRTIVVHPSGAFVATSSGDVDRTVRVWELASGRLVGTVTATGTGPIALAWAGDGRSLYATASDHLARWVFRAAEAQRFACQSGSPVEAASFISSDRVAALTDPIGPHRELLVGTPGNAATSAHVPERGGNGRPGVAASPGGALVVSAGSPGLVAWEPGAPVPPAAFTTNITRCPRFGPDGCTLWAIVSSSNVVAFDPVTKKPRSTWSNAVEGATRGLASLDTLAIGPTLVVAGGRSGSVHLLDAATGQFAASFSTFGDPVLSVTLSPDELLVVAGTQTGKLRVIRTCDREELPAVMAHPGGVTAVSVSHDGSLLATGGQDRVVRLWKRTGDRFEPVLAVSDLSGPVRGLQFGADDRLLVLIAHERAVRVWDVDRLKTQLGRFRLAW